MKIFVKSACIAFVLVVIYSLIPFQAQCGNISNDVFRLHILANSDSDYDQSVKLKVRDRVLEYSKSLFESASSKEEAESERENTSHISRIFHRLTETQKLSQKNTRKPLNVKESKESQSRPAPTVFRKKFYTKSQKSHRIISFR